VGALPYTPAYVTYALAKRVSCLVRSRSRVSSPGALLAQAGETERAVAALRLALERGADRKAIADERDFATLKPSAAFRKLFAGYPVFEKQIFG